MRSGIGWRRGDKLEEICAGFEEVVFGMDEWDEAYELERSRFLKQSHSLSSVVVLNLDMSCASEMNHY